MGRDKYGKTLCRDHALHCREIITEVAELAAELIYGAKEAVCSKAFGSNVENLKDNTENCDAKG